AVVDAVHAADAMAAGRDRALDLGAHAVRARRQPAASRQGVEAGKRAHALGAFLAVRGRDQRLDAFERALVGLDVDARRGVRKSLGGHTFASWGVASSNCILSISSCCGTGTG